MRDLFAPNGISVWIGCSLSNCAGWTANGDDFVGNNLARRDFDKCGCVETKKSVPANGLALVFGNVISDPGNHSNFSRCRTCRSLYLSAGDRSGDCSDLGGGGMECPMETAASNFGRVDGHDYWRVSDLRLRTDFLLAKRPVIMDA